MNVDTRRIRTLNLTVPDDSGARRAEQLCREAFRLASVPGDGLPGRLVFRELNLGSIEANSGAQSLARRIGALLRDAAAAAVPFQAPLAAQAACVRIAHESDVWFELARRATAAAPFEVNAWFWSLLVPGVTQRMDRKLTLARSIDGLIEQGAAELLPALLEQQLEADGAQSWVAVMSEHQALRALAALGYTQYADAHASDHVATASWATAISAALAPRWRSLVGRMIADSGATSARSVWLAHAVLHAHGHRLEANQARVAACALARHVAHANHAAPPSGSSPQLAAPSPVDSADSIAATNLETSERSQPIAQAWSESAGLYFALHILHRLEFPRLLCEQPALANAELARRVLTRLADSLDVAADDPVRALLIGLPPQPHARREFAVAASWPATFFDAAQREQHAPMAAPPAAASIDVAVDAWERALRAWLALRTELDLPSLVRRRGRVALTRTHLDIVFDLNSADVRIRKAGLDLDLGYVPYLRRVIQFHFVRNANDFA